jgi:RNase E specificity factor CsrD
VLNFFYAINEAVSAEIINEEPWMKIKNVYQKQWLTFGIILLLAVTTNTLIIYQITPVEKSLNLLIISDSLIAISLLIFTFVVQFLIKKAESETASRLIENLPTLKVFPLLSSVIQRNHDSLQQDLLKVKDLNSELELKVLQDNLTSLQNRSAFRKDITEFLEQESRSELACLCLIRSTELSTINHQRGRVAGDQYLKAIAEIAQYIGNRFSTNHIYRLSSSDYGILIKDTSTSIAPILGKELKQLFDNFQLQMSMDSTAYTGITFIRPGEQPEQALSRADLALAKAQTSIVNGWYIQESNAEDAFQGESHWHKTILSIIESRSVGFNGQSIQPLNMAVNNYVQIIPRFTGQNRQAMPTETVYAMAMRHGIMNKLEELVIDSMIHQHKLHSESAARWGLNLSVSALFNSSFMIWLERILLRENEIAPHLVFEIDEEVLDCHLAASIRMFEMLRRVGSRSCIAKFGKGLGSFRLYRELRPDYIKLDSALVDSIERDTASQQFVRMIVEISHRLGCVVIAEGVENMSQRETLERMYVDGVQGQLVSKIVPISN